ncbi:MAG TPA: glycyl-radical enzyme activating protein [Chthonomonadales bacterium]|nr:glycyl-radical enzyme activating protein [Chthonomonadales bacterium]
MAQTAPPTVTSGLVFDIQRFSLHDGPGIRTTVFLKGCPLRCAWCHNPESGAAMPQLAYYAARCIHCGSCLNACPNGAITTDEARVLRVRCQSCGCCARVCPSEALETVGKRQTVEEVLAVVLRDEPFYRTSGGGMTLSGGEPLFQPGFSLALLRAAREHGLHTAIETCALAPWPEIEALLPFTNLLMVDIKVVSAAKHRRLCRADNALILRNVRRLCETGAAILLRAPIVPGLNDTAQDIRKLGDLVLSLTGPPPLELMPYHGIGSGKYAALGMDYPLRALRSPENLGTICERLEGMGVRVVRDA